MLFWSQTAAVAFNAAAIGIGVALVTFTDLAFGWSTTLQADPHVIARWVDALSLPWRAWAPAAVPDLSLIERSQFFRLDGARVLGLDASRTLTGWWAFTILAIVTYGLLPRLALWALCVVRLRAATRALLLEDPRVAALLDRMATPAIETAAPEPEDARSAAALPHASHPDALVGAARGVIWSGSIVAAAADPHARRTLGIALSDIVEAGGGRTLAEDQAAAVTRAASSYSRARGSRRCWSSSTSSRRCGARWDRTHRSSFRRWPSRPQASSRSNARRGRARSAGSPIRTCISKRVPHEPAALRHRRAPQ
jgi:hypothetical protein